MNFKKTLRASNILIAGITGAILFNTAMLNAAEQKPHKALAWAKGTAEYSNIIPFVWIYKTSTPEEIKTKVDQQPAGYKTLFSWDLHRKYFPAEIKKLEKITGKAIPPDQLTGIDDHPADNPAWWDNGAEAVQKRFDTFFNSYKTLGGEMDYFILDYEKGMSNWSLKNKAETFKKISEDSRFPELAKKLGFGKLEDVYNWRNGDEYLRWNALMKERVADYITLAIYDPIKKYFPKTIMSNYSFYYHRNIDIIPDVNGHKSYKYGKGAIVGNRQSPELYCSFNQLANQKLDGKNKYAATPFNGFRYSLNHAISAILASDVKLMPWISHKNYKNSLVRESDLYQEMIFHLGLMDVDTILLWNPEVWSKTGDPKFYRDEVQDKLVSDCLYQLDEVITGKRRQCLVKNIVDWGSDYVITGMKLDDKTLWRFTPKMDKETKISDSIISENPLTLKVGDKTLTIPNGKILKPQKDLSNQGLWFTADVNYNIK